MVYSFNSTYYGKDYQAGSALLRARRPYFFKNAATGLGLFAMTLSICKSFEIERERETRGRQSGIGYEANANESMEI